MAKSNHLTPRPFKGLNPAITNKQLYVMITAAGEDAEADDSNEESVEAVLPAPMQEELYIEDPKKALRGFFEREGIFNPFTTDLAKALQFAILD